MQGYRPIAASHAINGAGAALTLTVAVLLSPPLVAEAGPPAALSSEELHEVFLAGEFSEAAYPSKRDGFSLKGCELLELIDIEETGLDLCVWKWTNDQGQSKIFVAVAGTEIGQAADNRTNIGQGNWLKLNQSTRSAFNLLGGGTGEMCFRWLQGCRRTARSHYGQALKVARKYVKQYADQSDAEVIVVGHSLGGGVAQYVAAKLGIRAICFDAAALGRESLSELTASQRQEASRNILHVSAQDDVVFYLTPLLPQSDHMGRVLIVPNALEDEYITPRWKLSWLFGKSRQADPYERHKMSNLMESLICALHDGWQPRVETPSVLLERRRRNRAPLVWAGRRAGGSPQKQRPITETALHATSGARRVTVVGSDTEADWLEQQLSGRLGRANVQRLRRRAQIDEIRTQAANFGAEIIVGTRSAWVTEPGTNEYVVTPMQTARQVRAAFSELGTAVKLVRDTMHLANRRSVGSQGLKKLATIDRMFGDIEDADPFDTKLLKGAERAYRIAESVQRDMDRRRRGEFTLLKSDAIDELFDIVLDEYGEDLAEEGLKYVMRRFVADKAVRQMVGKGMASSVVDLAKAMKEHARTGGMTPDVAQNYCETLLKTATVGLGIALTGNVHVASALGEASVQLSRYAAKNTEPWFRRMHFELTGKGNQIYDNWFAMMKLRAARGKSIMSFEEYLREDGTDPTSFSPEIMELAESSLAVLLRNQMINAKKAPQTLVMGKPSSSSSSLPDGVTICSNSGEVFQRLDAGRQERILIAGDGRQCRRVFEWAVASHGADKVRWVRTATEWEIRRAWQEHGAEVIVRQTKVKTYVETSEGGRWVSRSTTVRQYRRTSVNAAGERGTPALVPVLPDAVLSHPPKQAGWRDDGRARAGSPEPVGHLPMGDMRIRNIQDEGGVDMGTPGQGTQHEVSREQLEEESGVDFDG